MPFVGDKTVQVYLLYMNVLGPYGLVKEYQVERNMRDALLMPYVEGVSDIQRVIAGSYILYGSGNRV